MRKDHWVSAYVASDSRSHIGQQINPPRPSTAGSFVSLACGYNRDLVVKDDVLVLAVEDEI